MAPKFFGVFLGFMLMCIVSVVGLLSYNKYNSDEKISIMRVGVVVNEDDTIFRQLLSFLNGMNGIKNIFRMDIINEKDAYSLLESGDIQMAISIPDDFMEKAERMEAASFDIYVPKNRSVVQKEVISLVQVVERIMVVTEGAIYSLYEGIDKYSLPIPYQGMADEIMYIYIMQFMDRAGLYDTVYVSEYGEFSVAQYYLSAVILIFLMLFSVLFLSLYSRNNISAEIIISRGYLGKIKVILAKILSITLVLWSSQIFILLLIRLVVNYALPREFNLMFDINILHLLVVSMSMAIFINLIANVCSESGSRKTIYVLLVMLLSVVSAMTGSSYYLPDFLRKIIGIWPMRQWHIFSMQSLWSDVNYLGVILTDVFMLILGGGLYMMRLNRHE